MKPNLKFKHVAMSALLISAIGAPVAANAAPLPQTGDMGTNQMISKLDAGPATKMISLSHSNPLELAKKYAPETVSDWEKILDKYNKLKPQVEFLSLDLETVPSVAVKTVPSFASGALQKDHVAITLDKSIEVTSSVESGKTATLIEGIALEATEAKNITTMSAELPSFIKAQIELAEAADSKDWIVIKAALNQLMKEYKQQITELESTHADTTTTAPLKK
ncbi:hypothetical protein [Paenibacillus segetis]|uniref:Uncharacterized protein n=1 Tax=Paenibacillus segetis TaxID=1325360 RepID=A0ABQ1YGI5_9BACL|nr:hypothetical protein [Paenibacillus segetis]GGH23533.1 hypothetical protein GCM10008013_22710 [Paenibacillus segetis]